MSFKEKNNAVTNLISLIIQKTGGENTEQLSNFLETQQINNSFYEDATGENLENSEQSSTNELVETSRDENKIKESAKTIADIN